MKTGVGTHHCKCKAIYFSYGEVLDCEKYKHYEKEGLLEMVKILEKELWDTRMKLMEIRLSSPSQA